MEEIKISGMWIVENEEYKGELHIIKNKKMIRLVLQSSDLNPFTIKDFSDRLDIIRGESFLNNVKITLVDCVTLRTNTNFGTGIKTYLIDCKYCIYGLDFEDSERITFNQLNVRLTNTMEWSTLSGFESRRRKKGKIEEITYAFKNKIIFNANDNMKIEFCPCYESGANYLNSEKIVFKQHMIIRFKYKRLEKLKRIIDELNKIIALIEFSTNQNVNIIDISGIKNSQYVKLTERRRRYIQYRIYYSREAEIKDDENELYGKDKFFSCNLREICEVDGLRNWFEKYDDLKPIVDCYRKNLDNYELYNNIPKEEILLNLTKALEFYHTRFVVEDLEKYNSLISKMLSNALPENKKFINEFIYDSTQKQSTYILLKNRLVHLFLLEMPISYFENFKFVLNFINSVVETRHYYTHYNKSKQYKAMKGSELSISNSILQTVLECFILKEIGFKYNFIDKYKRKCLQQLKRNDIPSRENKYSERYKNINLNTSIENILKIVTYEYRIGDLLSYSIIENIEDDLYIKIKVNANKSYIIRILSKNKTDDNCNEIINNDRKRILYPNRGILKVCYFYNIYRILVYKEL